MPKQILKIDQFHGGLNSNSDPRDISDNELAEAVDIMVDELGRIRAMGGLATAVTSNTANICEGRGLFYFSHDRQDAQDGEPTVSQAGTIGGDDYLILCDNGGSGHDIYSRDENTWEVNKIDSNMTLPTYVVVDGAVRISDANFTLTSGSGSYNIWYGYIKRFNFPSTDLGGYWNASSNKDGHKYNQWWKEVSNYVVPGASELTIDTAMTNSEINTNTISLQVAKEPLNAVTISECEGNTTGWAFSNVGGGGETLSLENNTNVKSSGTASLCLTNNTTYTCSGNSPISIKADLSALDPAASHFDFSDKSIYFDLLFYNPTTLSKIIEMEIRVQSGGSTSDYAKFKIAPIDFQTTGVVFNELLELKEGAQVSTHGSFDKTAITDIDFRFVLDETGGGNLNLGGTSPVAPIIAIDNVRYHHQNLGSTPGNWDGFYRFYYSFIYDEKQESLLTEFTGNDFKPSRSTNLAFFDVFYHNPTATSAPNPRRTGARIYTSKKSVDGSGVEKDRFLVLECDWIKGIKAAGSSSYTPWKDNNSLTAETVQSTAELFVATIGFETYESINGHSSDIPNNTFVRGGGFKTAVVANRMLYSANLCYGEQSDKRISGDAMIKSSVNKFDLVVPERIIEVDVNDGDEIIKLETYADRILQFKKRKMYLINISQEIEFLEDTFHQKGVLHFGATCITDYGIAWVNRIGCYLYDGKNVTNLLEKGGRQIIKESNWNSFTTDNSIIGYIPKKRQLIVLKDCTGNTVLTGSIDVTGTNVNVPGTGTKFLTELSVGASILVTGETRIIDSITNDTTATVSVAWGSNLANDTSPERVPPGDIYLYDMVTQSWVEGNSKFTDSQIQSNFINDWNADLVHAHTSGTGAIEKWSDAGVSSSAVSFKTKDFDFGHPGQRKKVYKVYITYTGGGSQNIDVTYATDGGSSYSQFDVNLDDTSGNQVESELTPSASINNIKSFQLKFSGTSAASFEINDISIVYRLKPVK